jgi:hypothetical protein
VASSSSWSHPCFETRGQQIFGQQYLISNGKSLNVDRKKLHDGSYRVSSAECQAKYVSRIGVLVRCTLKEIQKLTKEKAYEN